jgi:hypothetical protein
MGNFMLMIETRAVKTGVKGKLAAWAFIMLRKELGDDVLDVAHVGPIDDTGDRLA